MIWSYLLAASLAAAVQSAPQTDSQTAPEASNGPALTDLAKLPIAESTGPRCGVAFAIVEGWQQAGNEQGAKWPDIEASGGKEFFVRAIAKLMDSYTLSRDDVNALVQLELRRHMENDGETVEAMMPGCLALLDASGITPPAETEPAI